MSFAPPALLVPGLRLDRYELLYPIAEGGMASVWVARLVGKHGFEKLVAVKTILPRFATDERFRTMFLDEARIASGIDHTNVARILDLGEELGVLYLAMEWVDGDSLSKLQRLLAKKGIALPQGIVLRILADACAGLHAAHELLDRDGRALGVVHRDVSPQNILVSGEGVAKIIDFGIAKAVDRAAADTAVGTLKGKIRYMAPEQALAKSVDRRADVWAIGAILYNLFSGRGVYEGENEVAVLGQLVSGMPPAPLPMSIPAPLRQVIMGALRPAADQRWSTTAELRRQIEKAMVDIGTATTTADVAAFFGEFLPERTTARRSAVERALQQANRVLDPGRLVPDEPSNGELVGVAARPSASLVTNPLLEVSAANAAQEAHSGITAASTFAAAPPGGRSRRAGVALSLLVVGGLAALGVASLVGHFRTPASGPATATTASASAASPGPAAVSESAAAPVSPTGPSTGAVVSAAPNANDAPLAALGDASAAPPIPIAVMVPTPGADKIAPAPNTPNRPPPAPKHPATKKKATDDGF